MPKSLLIACVLLSLNFAQQQGQPPQQPESKPQIKVNYLNVCKLSDEDQAILKSALNRAAGKSSFADDFELSRGHTTIKDSPPSRFVRLRRDFASDSQFLTAQYSMSSDTEGVVELMVLRTRDPKEFHELALEDTVSPGVATASAIVMSDTPVDHIRLERLGKSSIVLARCPTADQSAYEPVFRQASEVMARYRTAIGARTEFRRDFSWLGLSAPPSAAQKPPSASKK